MLIDDEAALREWLVATLEPLCDAEPTALARYVLALVTKDKPLDKLRENCIDRLEVFLDRATKDFVDQLFEVIRNGRYIPEAKKENVQPKASEGSEDKSGDSAENLELQTSTSPSKQENEQEQEQQQTPSTSQATSSAADYSSAIPTTTSQQSSGALIQPVKRRYPYRSSSGRHSPNPRRHVNNSSGGANRHQPSSHYRQTTNSSNQRSHRSSSRSRSGSPPPAKRSQRSYSHSSSGSSSRSSPSRQTTSTGHQPPTTTTNFLYKRTPCSDFFENKGYCARGDACPYDHGTNALVFDQQHQQHQQQQQQQHPYYPPYQQYGIPPGHLRPHYHEYNPETPDLKHAPHQGPRMFIRHPMHHHPRMAGPPLAPGQMPPSQQQMMMMNPQRTLVTVVTNAEPLPLEQRLRQNDSMSMPNSSIPPVGHNKRHATAGPYPNERRPHHHQSQQQQQHYDHPGNTDSNNQSHTNINTNNNNNPSNPNNGYNNRGWKRPWQKQDASGSTPATLEIRKIPVEFNTISKLNEHFSKFGTVTNVQIAYDGASDSALVAYATFHEAETAYKNPEPLFNNRFIKIFWHNSNKNQSSGNNNNNANNSNQNNQQQSSSDAPTAKKPSSSAPNPMKLHWMKMQQMSGNKSEQPTTTPEATPPAPASTAVAPPVKKAPVPSSAISKKEATKKAVLELHRKKQGLLEEQIQQQKLLLKKLETAETNAEKESIRGLMKQVDATILSIKDALRVTPPAQPPTPAAPTNKISQQDALKQRAQTLQKQLETLRAKTSADMRRAMSSTLSQSSMNLPSVAHENDSKNKSSNDDSTQMTIKNIENLPRNELEEFLKKSGATEFQPGDSDDSLVVIFPSTFDVNQIQKDGLTFQDQKLDISFADDSLLNTSSKKRTLSETFEDELLGASSADTTNPEEEDEPEAKRRNQSQTSDTEQHEENVEDEEHLLGDNGTKHANVSTSHDDDFEPQDLDDEVQLLDS